MTGVLKIQKCLVDVNNKIQKITNKQNYFLPQPDRTKFPCTYHICRLYSYLYLLTSKDYKFTHYCWHRASTNIFKRQSWGQGPGAFIQILHSIRPSIYHVLGAKIQKWKRDSLTYSSVYVTDSVAIFSDWGAINPLNNIII